MNYTMNYDGILTDWGEVILATEPYLVLAEKEEVERRILNRENQTGFWKEVIERWIDEGRLIISR